MKYRTAVDTWTAIERRHQSNQRPTCSMDGPRKADRLGMQIPRFCVQWHVSLSSIIRLQCIDTYRSTYRVLHVIIHELEMFPTVRNIHCWNRSNVSCAVRCWLTISSTAPNVSILLTREQSSCKPIIYTFGMSVTLKSKSTLISFLIASYF